MHGIVHRLRGMAREIKLSQSLIMSAFASCKNVHRLELVLNGPWFKTTRKHAGRSSVYANNTQIAQILDHLCVAFQDNLQELRITMHNVGHVRRVLQAPIFQRFSSLEVLELAVASRARPPRLLTDELATFICLFHQTVRTIRLYFHDISADPIGLLLGGITCSFPRLERLELSNLDVFTVQSRGYHHLSSFFRKTPSLKSFHLLQDSISIWNDSDVGLEFPSNLVIEELGTDERAWALHSAALSAALRPNPPTILYFEQTSPYPILEAFGQASNLAQFITELHLTSEGFDVCYFIRTVGFGFPSLESLSIVCQRLLHMGVAVIDGSPRCAKSNAHLEVSISNPVRCTSADMPSRIRRPP